MNIPNSLEILENYISIQYKKDYENLQSLLKDFYMKSNTSTTKFDDNKGNFKQAFITLEFENVDREKNKTFVEFLSKLGFVVSYKEYMAYDKKDSLQIGIKLYNTK